MYDPLERAKEIVDIVCKDNLRKYYRFRSARFYGGIATADCVGCNLSCIFCWSYPKVKKPERYGTFHSAEDVARTLTNIARKKRFTQIRISGNEPTISRDHLLYVFDLIPGDITFILETNGILIGHDETFAQELADYKNLHVRVSLKGATEDEFNRLTGANPTGFALQLKALENLKRAGVRAHPAAMVSFSHVDSIMKLKKRLRDISPDFEDFEVEELALYGDVQKRIENARLFVRSAHDPRNIPLEQV